MKVNSQANQKRQNDFTTYLIRQINFLSTNIYNSERYQNYNAGLVSDLQSYIDSTRLQKSNPKINFEYYDIIYLLTSPILSKHRLYVTFQTVYSINRKNETVKIDGRDFIIYDQYLGKTINVFNKIYFQLKKPEFIFHYSLRYLIESFRVKGRGLEADLFIDISRNHDSFKKLNKAYSTKNEMPAITFVQETFIIFHEIAHLILKNNKRYFTFKFNEVSKYIDQQPFFILSKGSDNINGVLSFDLSPKRRDNLIEEIVCDYISVKYTFQALFNLNFLDPEDFCQAIYLGLRSMRSLNLLDGYIVSYCNDYLDNNGKSNLSQLFMESSIRFWLIKDSLHIIANGKRYKHRFKKNSPLTKALENDLYDLSDYYEDPIHKVDEILNVCHSVISKETKPNISYEEMNEILDYVDRVLGLKEIKET